LVIGGKTEFSRYYAREPWRNHYSSPDLPEHKLTAAVLQDIRIGLEAPAKAENPKPENPTKTKKQSKPSAKSRLQSP
jgi:hypothetical protein